MLLKRLERRYPHTHLVRDDRSNSNARTTNGTHKERPIPIPIPERTDGLEKNPSITSLLPQTQLVSFCLERSFDWVAGFSEDLGYSILFIFQIAIVL